MRTIPDISHYQKVSWAKFKPEVLIVKATEGTIYADNTLSQNIKESRKRDISIGAYHFAQGGDAKKEAEWFLKNASDLDFLVCDFEIPHPDPVGWCKTFCDRVAKAGKPVLLYMNDSTALKYDWSPCRYPFWIARYKYPGGDSRDDGKPDSKYAPKSNWLLWQFTSNGKMDGITGRVDLNQAKDEFFEFIKTKPSYSQNTTMTYFGQRDPRWAQVKLGNTQRTVAQVGCTTCTLSDATSWFKIERDPGILAQTLTYTTDALIVWTSLPTVGLKLKQRFFGHQKALIAAALKDPNTTVSLNVDSGAHWVFALNSLPFNKYWVHDPYYDRKTVYGGVVGGAIVSKA